MLQAKLAAGFMVPVVWVVVQLPTVWYLAVSQAEMPRNAYLSFNGYTS